jgi:hypothetical protein
MALTIGGFYIKSYEGTRSHGPEPASAGGVGILNAGGSVTIGTGDYVALSIMGVMFYGIVSTVDRIRSVQDGDEYTFQMLDNRIRLRWALVFGRWNMQEESWRCHSDPIPGRPSALDEWSGGEVGFDQGVDFLGGIESEMGSPAPLNSPGSPSRGKMYAHIPPGMWASQQQVYSEAPMTAAQIIQEAVRGCLGGSSVSLVFHADQQKPVFSVDANSGMSLSAFLQQMADSQGLQFSMDGVNVIRFTRRGEGIVVIPVGAHHRRFGTSLSSEPTKVRVVGGRRLVQVNEVPMVPDWNRSWERFMLEPMWLEECRNLAADAGPLLDDAAGRAEIAAWAREITLSQYIALKKVGSENPADLDSEFSDNGRYGRISRMNMPVWTYLNQIVFRSYRISEDAMLYGIPARKLEIHDQLLCSVFASELDDETRTVYREDPLEFYPQTSAFVLAKGQPLDLSCAEQTEALLRQRSKDLHDVWSEIPDFELDPENHSIRFATPVFQDGYRHHGTSILLYPNRGDSGGEDLSVSLGAGNSYLDVVKPNPDFVISPAEVRVALAFRLGLFFKDFGAGPRWTVQQVDSIAEHLLHAQDGFAPDGTAVFSGDAKVPSPPPEGFVEILMESGQSAVEAATDQAAGLTVRSGVEESGEYIRYGVAGASLNGAIDRITVRLTSQGLEENVEFAKPRPSRGFRSTREVADRLRQEELFDGQKALQKDVSNLRAIASSLRAIPYSERVRSSTYYALPDVFRKPVGAPDGAVIALPDPNSQWPEGRHDSDGNPVVGWLAGDLVWLDDSGMPSRSGQLFGGVCVMDSIKVSPESSEIAKYVNVCRSGASPAHVVPGSSPGAVFANPGDWKASSSGSWPIGMLGHASAVPGTREATLAVVRLGGGGAAEAVVVPPLTIVSVKPLYVPPPSVALAEDHARFFVTWGTVNGVLATNWENCVDVPTSSATVRYIAVKAYIAPVGDFINVTHCEWVTYTQSQKDAGDFDTPDYGAAGERPAHLYISIGMIVVDSAGVASILNTSGGSIQILEYVAGVDFSSGGGVKYKKALNATRLPY